MLMVSMFYTPITKTSTDFPQEKTTSFEVVGLVLYKILLVAHSVGIINGIRDFHSTVLT